MTKKRRFGNAHIEDSITNLLKPLYKKDKKNFIIINNLIKNWEKIVGKRFVKFCQAKTISFDKFSKDGQKKQAKLTIAAFNSATGFFLKNNSDIIIDRISQLYGYQAISKIIIKQEPKEIITKNKEEPKLNQKQQKTLESQIKNVKNQDLKLILSKLGADIMSKK